MGGMGSGGWMRCVSKTTVDSQHAVDIRYLKKQGSIWNGNNGSLTWSCRGEQTGAINYQVKENGIKLIYNHRAENSEEWQAVEQFVAFDYTPCNYGGKRTWLLCTECNKRVTCIYAAGKYFLCRHCYGLNHQSQHEGFYDHQLSKVQGIRIKLGGSGSLAESFPQKPKGMHWKTYQKLHMQSMRSEGSYMQKMDQHFKQLTTRFG